jgi:hypothetical protein
VEGLSLPTASDNATCGKTPALLNASGPYTNYHWYNQLEGGSIIHTGASYLTDSLENSQTFYVAGVGPAACESSPRIPVTVTTLDVSSSPNCLTIYAESYPSNEVKLFDRWGNIIFEKKSYDNRIENAWKGFSNTGLSKGQKVPDGTYYYEININGLSKPLSGFITVNREH